MWRLVLNLTRSRDRELERCDHGSDGSAAPLMQTTSSRSALGVDVPLHPEAEIIDARTVRYHGKNFLDAWTQARRL